MALEDKKERDMFALTGLPVSDELQDILDRCERGEYVSVEEIESTPEMKAAASCVSYQIPTVQMKDREQIEDHVFEILSNYGSVSLDDEGKPQVDGHGNTIYNRDVERGSRLDIVIGLPASGKSSAIVDTISYTNKSMLIDNDEAKRLFPEFNKGWGAGVVHAESQMVERSVYLDALSSGKNIVLPKVGSDPVKLIQDYILPAKNKGYKVNVHFVDLDRSRALGRMLRRFIHKGRYLAPKLIDKYVNERDGNRIAKSFEQLCKSSMIDGISRWDNDVGFGMPPKLQQTRGLTDDYVTEAHIEYISEDKASKLLGELIETLGIKSDMHARDFSMQLKIREEENRNMNEMLNSTDHPVDMGFMKVIQSGMRNNLYDMQKGLDDIYKAIDALGGRDKLSGEMRTAVLHFEVATAIQSRDVSRMDKAIAEMVQMRDELVADSILDTADINDKENGGKNHDKENGEQGDRKYSRGNQNNRTQSARDEFSDSSTGNPGELRVLGDGRKDRGGSSQSVNRDERDVRGDRQSSENGSPQTQDGDNEKAHGQHEPVVEIDARHPYKQFDDEEIVGIDDKVQAGIGQEEMVTGIENQVSMSTFGQLNVNRQIDKNMVSEPDAAYELAVRLDQWYQDYDLYGYKDSVEDTEQNISEIKEAIESGQTEIFKEHLMTALEEEHSNPDTLVEAEKLIKALDEYKPLAKVEEIEEQNYNMIDNRINNVEPKEEKEAEKKQISTSKAFPGAKYSNFKIQKNVENIRFALIADVKMPGGERISDQVIGEFKDKEAVETFCKKNNIAYDDITNYLQNMIEHKKQKVKEKDEKTPDKDGPILGKKERVRD